MKRYKIEFSNHKLSVNESYSTSYTTSHIYDSTNGSIYMFTNEQKLESDLEKFKKHLKKILTSDIDNIEKFELNK